MNDRNVSHARGDVTLEYARACTGVRPSYLGALRAQTIAIVGHSPRLPFSCAGLGCARLLGRYRRHRVHDLANICGKYGFAENQESLELLGISNS